MIEQELELLERNHLTEYGWKLCSYNYGKNLEDVLVFGEINNKRIVQHLLENLFSSFIDFEDKDSEIFEKMELSKLVLK